MGNKSVRVRRTQAERSDETRRRVLDAAVEVLRVSGYAGFRTAAVAKAATVSRGAQAHHFPTKNSLVLGATEHIFSRAKDRALERVGLLDADSDIIRALIEDSASLFMNEEFFMMLGLGLGPGRNSELAEQASSIARAYRLPVEQAWREALQANGYTAQNANDLVWLTNSIVRGLAVRSLWQKDLALYAQILERWQAIVRAQFPAPANRNSKAGPAPPRQYDMLHLAPGNQ